MKFKVGDVVEMSNEALAQLLQGRLNRRRGFVTSILDGRHIRVKRHGLKHTETWCVDFWKPTKV
jgi:hypothetical protein